MTTKYWGYKNEQCWVKIVPLLHFNKRLIKYFCNRTIQLWKKNLKNDTNIENKDEWREEKKKIDLRVVYCWHEGQKWRHAMNFIQFKKPLLAWEQSLTKSFK